MLASLAASSKTKAPGAIYHIMVHHTTCFGRCPDYTIQLDKNGLITYTGNRFTTDSGVYTKNIGKARATSLLQSFRNYRPDTCTNMYENMIPDLPGLNFEIKYRKKTKKIINAGYGPTFLKEISAKLEEIGHPDSTWTHK